MAYGLIAKMPGTKTARAVRLLLARCTDLREVALNLLRDIWANLILVDRDSGQITINKTLDGKASSSSSVLHR